MIPNLPLSPDDVRDIAYRFGLLCMIVGFLCGAFVTVCGVIYVWG